MFTGGAQSTLSGSKKYFQPFYDVGTDALNNYYSTIQGLISDPTALENQIMGSYTMSPWAQYQTNTLSDQVNRSAALGGNLGTPNEQLDMANQLQGIVSQDQQQYLQNAMTPYMAGLSGEQYLTGTGLKSAFGMAGVDEILAKLQAQESGQMLNLFGGLTGAGIGAASKYGASAGAASLF